MWRSRSLRLDARSHTVPSIHSMPVSSATTVIDSVPATAAVTTSALPISAPAAANNQLSTVRQKIEQQLKESSQVVSLWPPVIAGALRHRVWTAFCGSFFINYCHMLCYTMV